MSCSEQCCLLSARACTAQGLRQAHLLCSSFCDQLSQGAFLVAAGHTGFNYLVKYVHPLIISLVLTLEPLVGSMLGWARSVAPLPGDDDDDTAPLCHKALLSVQGMTAAYENCVRIIDAQRSPLCTGMWTWIGGSVTLGSTAAVTIAAHYRERAAAAAAGALPCESPSSLRSPVDVEHASLLEDAGHVVLELPTHPPARIV